MFIDNIFRLKFTPWEGVDFLCKRLTCNGRQKGCTTWSRINLSYPFHQLHVIPFNGINKIKVICRIPDELNFTPFNTVIMADGMKS